MPCQITLGWTNATYRITASSYLGTAYADEEAVQNLTDEQGGTVTLYAQWRLQHRFNYDSGIFRCYNSANTNEVYWAYEGETVKVEVRDGSSEYTIYVTAEDGTDIAFDTETNTFTMPDQEVYVTSTSVKKMAYTTILLDDFDAWTDVVYLYDASQPTVTPTVTVKDGEAVLTEGTDYTLEITNNTGSANEMVTATATVTGKGGWGGSKTFQFQVVELKHTVVFVANGGSGTMASDVATKGQYYTLPECAFTAPAGQVFDHWVVSCEPDEEKQLGDYFTAPYIWGENDVVTITVTAYWRDAEKVNLAANQAPDGNYWTTYYNGTAGFKIDDAENACAYTATYDGTNVITLHKLGKEIPAGTAVIIVADNNEVSMTEATLSTFSGDNSLRGVDVDTPTADIQNDLGNGTFYVLGRTVVNEEQHFGFHKYEGTEMAARKAFVLVNGTGAALARSLTMVFDDATGITTTNFTDYTDSEDAWYSLDGQRLMGKPAKSGIYVNNGRKIVIK